MFNHNYKINLSTLIKYLIIKSMCNIYYAYFIEFMRELKLLLVLFML